MRPSARTGGENSVTNRTMSAVRSIGTAPLKFDLPVVGYMDHFALYNRIIRSATHRLVELALPAQSW
jgi:hypothetical protein